MPAIAGVLTDLSGQFDTVVQEVSASSLTQQPSFRDSFERMRSLVVSGRDELWTLEAEG